MKTDLMPLIVGLSLCGASAALLYIWYKTKDQDEDTVDAPSPKKVTKLECVIPNTIVPLVLGRSGATVKDIEAKTQTLIRFRENNENSQVCEISGSSPANVQRAAELIKQEASPPPIITEELTVPQTACGKIIGRCGETLHEICRKSMAKVYVESGSRGGDGQSRIIKITGTRAHVNIARSLIEENVRRDEEMRRSVEETEAKREPRGRVNGALSAASSHSSIMSSNESLPVVGVTPKSAKLPAASTDGQLEVYVSAIASPGRFWVQLVGPQSKKLDSLTEEMSTYYDIEENRNLHKIADPYLGQIVTAVFRHDGKWYRAEIVGILPNVYNPRNVELDLYFVDFGDSEYVSPHEVYELRTDFLTLRFQAIECFLANVKPNKAEEKYDEDSVSLFEELTHVARWQKINARIVTTKEREYADPRRAGSPVPGVELFDSIDGNEINIGTELVRRGYALEHVSDAIGTDQVLRLNNGSADNAGPTTPPISNIAQLTNMMNNGHHTINTPSTNGTSTALPIPSSSNQSSSNTVPTKIPTTPQQNQTKNEKYTAICENTSNENYENTKIDQSQLIGQFIANEQRQQNGLNANTSSDSSSVIKNGHFDGNLNDLTTPRPEQTA